MFYSVLKMTKSKIQDYNVYYYSKAVKFGSNGYSQSWKANMSPVIKKITVFNPILNFYLKVEYPIHT